jgi:hypothetical protein
VDVSPLSATLQSGFELSPFLNRNGVLKTLTFGYISLHMLFSDLELFLDSILEIIFRVLVSSAQLLLTIINTGSDNDHTWAEDC